MAFVQQKKLSFESLELRTLLAALSYFSFLDVTPTSPTFNQNVSPRDYLGQVSAWYFGHST